MRHIRLYEDYFESINEGFSPILYHATNLWSAEKILRDDVFHLTNTIGSENERGFHKEFYYMSFARSLTSGYNHFQNPSSGVVIFKIDGIKLGNRYRGMPVDYWSRWGVKDRNIEMQRGMELEDRLISNTPIVKGAKSYIEEIYLYVGDWDNEEGWTISDLKDAHQSIFRKIILIANSSNIPLYIYSRKEDLLMGNKEGAISYKDLDLSAQYIPSGRINWDSEITPWVSILYKMYNSATGDELIDSLTDKEKKIFNDHIETYSGFTNNIVLDINRDLFNIRAKNSKISNKIASIMNREGYSSVKEFVNKMFKKLDLGKVN